MQENNFSKERAGDLLQSTEAWERERPGKINALKLMSYYIYIYKVSGSVVIIYSRRFILSIETWVLLGPNASCQSQNT